MIHLSKILSSLLFTLAGCLLVIPIQSQDLEPRMMSPIPAGGNFAIASYGYSAGNILLDKSLPVEDLEARLNNLVVAYARSFRLFSRLTKFDVIVPYSFAKFEGAVSGIDSSTSRSGFGDPLFRLSMVLIGTKAMGFEEYLQHEQRRFNLGAVIRIRPPLGQYDPTKFINLGSNRWATKVGMAGSYIFGKRFTLEAHFNSWFFSENEEFFNGNSLKQKPLITTQFHASYIFKPGIWLAVSVGRSFLGETILNGEEKDDLQNSSRFGAVFAYKLNKQNALKLALTSGITTRYGSDFTSLIIAYQMMWFDKKN